MRTGYLCNLFMAVTLPVLIIIVSTKVSLAEYAQTLGIGQKSTNLGGAVTATADDYDVFFTNPAGAANFKDVYIGIGIKTLDTRTLDAVQTGATPTVGPIGTDILNFVVDPDIFETPRNGVDVSPEGTLPENNIGIIPSFGAYAPLPNAPNVVVGIGFGAPFVVSGNFGNENEVGNYGKFNSTDASLLIIEASPTVGIKVNERLNIGGSIGITTFKYLRLAAELGTLAGTGSFGSASLQSDGDVWLPFAPHDFSTSPTDVSFTLGMQYKLSPKLSFGVTYRSETPETFEGPFDVSVKPLGIFGFTPLGNFTQRGRFTTDIELPRHLQVGLAYDATPEWSIMADVRWSNWSNAKGFGSPTVFDISGINLGGEISDQLEGLGFLVPSAPTKTLSLNYEAEDTFSFHFGTSYQLTSNFEVQAGYVYDPAFMPEDTADLITFSSDRHIFSLGGTYKKQTESGEWALTAGGQVTYYEDRTIDPGESATAGGLNNTVSAIFSGDQDVEFRENALGGLELGGYIWSVGVSLSYKFGGSLMHEGALK